MQVSIMMCCTLASISVQRELSPYRRASDNTTALFAQVLVFAWVFVLQLRIVGIFVTKVAAAVVGTLLCVATVGVFAMALGLANVDRLREQRADRRQSSTLNTPESLNHESDEDESEHTQEGDVKLGEAAGSSFGRASPHDAEEKVEESGLALSLPWSLLMMSNANLCGAETAEEDDTTAQPPPTTPSEAATRV